MSPFMDVGQCGQQLEFYSVFSPFACFVHAFSGLDGLFFLDETTVT